MAIKKTYILAPNFTTTPDGPFKIGAIIANPLRPTKPLSFLNSQPEVYRHEEQERNIRRTTSHGTDNSVWAQFLQSVGFGVGLSSSKEVVDDYSMDCLETVYLRNDPTDEDVQTAAQDPKIQAAISAGLFGDQPVYMITGLKIAKRFTLTRGIDTTRGANFNVTLPVTDQVSVGTEVAGHKGESIHETSKTTQDIVFAYQLHIIATKGWRKKHTTVDQFAPKYAFLNDDEREYDSERLEVVAGTLEDLQRAVDEQGGASLRIADAEDESGHCLCIFPM